MIKLHILHIVAVYVVLAGLSAACNRAEPGVSPALEPASTPVATLTAVWPPTWTPGPAPTSSPAKVASTPGPGPTRVCPPPPAIAPLARSASRENQTWPDDGVLLIYVPAGEFLMGSSTDPEATEYEKPEHKAKLNAFWIDRTEVTNAMFACFVAATGYKTDAEKQGASSVYGEEMRGSQVPLVVGADWRHPRGPASSIVGLDNHPVTHISWNDAAAYCQWAGRQLPTEVQWEKGARGTDGRKYPWGNKSIADNLANLADSSLNVTWADKNLSDGWKLTAPVGSYPAGTSPYGALDMAGNVWEWVTDSHTDSRGLVPYQTSQVATPNTGRMQVIRGGGWASPKKDVRVTARAAESVDAHNNTLGFRCALSTGD